MTATGERNGAGEEGDPSAEAEGEGRTRARDPYASDAGSQGGASVPSGVDPSGRHGPVSGRSRSVSAEVGEDQQRCLGGTVYEQQGAEHAEAKLARAGGQGAGDDDGTDGELKPDRSAMTEPAPAKASGDAARRHGGQDTTGGAGW